jgi:asparagine synthase (glutamine-hydrolysing)
MCGICGIVNLHPDHPADEGILIAMRDSLSHRGPDGNGLFIQRNVGLGHTRLSIIDLATGSQPMHNEDSSVWIVFNGEIYNFVELRSELQDRGHTFTTTSDTETLLHLYEDFGTGMLDRLNGMFAFALWDVKNRELFLARDRVGKKPLFYSLTRDTFVFASELKALIQHPSVSREIDPLSLSKYLTYEYVPAPHSIFRGVQKLLPGHFLSYRASSREVIQKKYWDIPLSDDALAHKTEDEYKEELAYLLEEAVRIRLRSDVPVGVFLSGGIDSSLITALASRHTNQVRTFSIGFNERSFDETKYANTVAERFRTVHACEVLDVEKTYDLLPEIMGFLDEPLGDASIIPTFLLSRFAAKNVKVVLGGDGGDELFAGYPTYQAMKLINYYSILPREIRAIIHKWASYLPVSHRNISLDFKIKQLLRGAGVSPEIMLFMWMGSFNEAEKKQLLLPEVWESVRGQNPFEDLLNYVKESNLHTSFARALYLSMKLYLQDDILVKVDRASMARSLEVRAPFLDRRVVEFAAQLPASYKLHRLTTKYILKGVGRQLLPRGIAERAKKGFGIPVARWIHGELREVVSEYLGEARIRREGMFSPQYVASLIADHLTYRRDNRKLLWTLLIFQMWRERWCNGR